MQKKNGIEYYSNFTNYLDSNSCYENFYYRTECARRCRKDNIPDDLLNEAATLYMVHDALEEIKSQKPEIIDIVSEYINSQNMDYANIEDDMVTLKDHFFMVSPIALYAVYMNCWWLKTRGQDSECLLRELKWRLKQRLESQ